MKKLKNIENIVNKPEENINQIQSKNDSQIQQALAKHILSKPQFEEKILANH